MFTILYEVKNTDFAFQLKKMNFIEKYILCTIKVIGNYEINLVFCIIVIKGDVNGKKKYT